MVSLLVLFLANSVTYLLPSCFSYTSPIVQFQDGSVAVHWADGRAETIDTAHSVSGTLADTTI